MGGTAMLTCGDCKRGFAALAEGLTKSTIGFAGLRETYYPELAPHPRIGIPSHGRPDTQPKDGGEFFASRGIGMDYTPGCFVCGGEEGLYSNIAAFVRTKAAGERVVNIFTYGARLDYREFEPDHVQVKIGACETHLRNLEKLHRLTEEKDGVITQGIVSEARRA